MGTRKLIFMALIVLVPAILVLGYIQANQPPIVGGDKDEHGCVATAGYTWCESKQKCLRAWEEECATLCTPEQRDADACIEMYQPVCGWSDPDKIQCLVYPCASTYSNSCFACQDENVRQWTEGQCPVDDRGCQGLCEDQRYRTGTCKAAADAEDYELDIGCIDSGSAQCSGPGQCKCVCNEFVPAEINASIIDFETCVAAGNPILESYPRQCLTMDGRSFAEDVGDATGDATTGSLLTGKQAKILAKASSCVENGTLGETVSYNQITKTWWFDIDMESSECNPACVVFEETNETEINWRCTGLL